MTENASWFEDTVTDVAAPRQAAEAGGGSTWAQRFRGAVLGGAVGDALGSGVRHWSSVEVQRRLGPHGVRGYLPVFGAAGACTELTQLTAFTLEALLRAKAFDRDTANRLPTSVVRANHLRWLYTQGVPWEYAMSGYLHEHPEPGGWLLECPELFSTRNPAGRALAGLGRLATLTPAPDGTLDPRCPPVVPPGFTECLSWAAPAMVWDASGEVVFAAATAIAKILTGDRDVQIAAGIHAEVLGKLMHGETDLWAAVSASEARSAQAPVAGVRRAVHGAMFLTRDRRRPGPVELDAEFDSDRELGELGVALASVAATDNFADAVLMAVNQSADSSVTGALAGQLAGARYGPQEIPQRWLRDLELLDIIETLCADAAQAFAPPPPPPPLPKWAQRYVTDRGPGFSGPLELTPAPVAEVADPPVPDATPAGFSEPEDPAGTETTLVIDVVTAEYGSAAESPAVDPPAVDAPAVESPAVDVVAEPVIASEPDLARDDAESAQHEESSSHDVADPLTFDTPKPSEDDPAVRVAEPVGGHALVDDPGQFPPSLTERVLGCFLGGALGDALGADLEFLSAEDIDEKVGPDGPRGLRTAFGVQGAITDDTQMTLFTAEALIRAGIARRRYGVDDPIPEIQLAYQRWLHTQGVEWDRAAGAFAADYPRPDGWLVGVPKLYAARAPGNTVLRALAAFGDGAPAGSPTRRVNDSKGCGGTMRSAPIALYSTDPPEVFELAARAAALTHGHPSGYLSAGALAVIVQQALLGQDLDDGVWLALQVLETWEGHEETSIMLKVAVDLAGQGVPSPERIAQVLGGGWTGEQALGIAVCAALVGADDVELALRTAVRHAGDSDSTGAICGNIVGALVGIGGLPMDWLAELELREVIEQIALDCVAEFGVGEFFPAGSAHAQPTDEDWTRRYPVHPRPAQQITPLVTGLAPEAAEPRATIDGPAATDSVVLDPAVTDAGVTDAGNDESTPTRGIPMPPAESFGPVPEEPRQPELLPESSASLPAAEPDAEANGPYDRQSATRVSDREYFRIDAPVPRPAPRRINGVVSNFGDGD